MKEFINVLLKSKAQALVKLDFTKHSKRHSRHIGRSGRRGADASRNVVKTAPNDVFEFVIDRNYYSHMQNGIAPVRICKENDVRQSPVVKRRIVVMAFGPNGRVGRDVVEHVGMGKCLDTVNAPPMLISCIHVTVQTLK